MPKLQSRTWLPLGFGGVAIAFSLIWPWAFKIIAGEQGSPTPAELEAVAEKAQVQIRITSPGEATVVTIECPRGIGRATLRRKGAAWPKSLVVRLHLRGLESFQVRQGATALEWSISSTGAHEQRMALRENDRETPLARDAESWTEVKFVGGPRVIPLKEGGFEIAVPRKLLANQPAELELNWVDFYRQ